MREALLTAGAQQFASRGVAHVSVEDLLDEADVSRATFYAIFSSKYSLLENILNPIFEIATASIAELQKASAGAGLSGILDTYLKLWRAHREGLLLITAVDAATFRHFEDRHRALNDALYEVLSKAERAGLLPKELLVLLDLRLLLLNLLLGLIPPNRVLPRQGCPRLTLVSLPTTVDSSHCD